MEKNGGQRDEERPHHRGGGGWSRGRVTGDEEEPGPNSTGRGGAQGLACEIAGESPSPHLQ